MEEKQPFEDETGDLRLSESPMAFSVSYAPQDSVAEAIDIIQAHLDSGKSFTNAQIDVCTQVLATMLPQSERDMLVEVSEQNKYPLWVGLLAQWRRCVEYGEQYAILTDPDWDKAIDERAHELNGAVVVVDDKDKQCRFCGGLPHPDGMVCEAETLLSAVVVVNDDGSAKG
jgi:hypothetical protein